MREARHFRELENRRVECRLCPHQCKLDPGQSGICRVRRNEDGKLISLNADRLVAANVDPIEKKPLYHFYPGRETLSIAGAGCNFHCTNCQNHTISQANEALIAGARNTRPADIVRSATERGLHHITFTYTEPTVFFELMLETAICAREQDIRLSMVSNGFINPEPLAELLPYLDAANIDLKFGTDDDYRRITKGWKGPVLDTIRTLWNAGVITEVTTLIIPGLNDSPETFNPVLDDLKAISNQIPWHLSAFYPTFQMTDKPPTKPDTIRNLRALALDAGMQYVYTGNIVDESGADTRCPHCGATVIRRSRLMLRDNRLIAGGCQECATPIYGRFS